MPSNCQESTDARQRLLDAAQRVFAESGYLSASVDDIITAAAASRATFYRHFRSKDHVFHELSRGCFLEMETLTKALAAFDPASDTRDGLEKLVVGYSEMQERQRGVVRAWLEQVDRPKSPVHMDAAKTFYALLNGLEQRIMAVGTPSDVDADVQAALLFVLLNRATFYVRHRHSRVNPDLLPPTLTAMLHRAFFGRVDERRSRLRLAGVGQLS
jgi:AcrR family transcriptional regulator